MNFLFCRKITNNFYMNFKIMFDLSCLLEIFIFLNNIKSFSIDEVCLKMMNFAPVILKNFNSNGY